MMPKEEEIKTCLVIVAHPDDETLWAGGTILMHPTWNWLVVCLCRKRDEDRAPKFGKALLALQAEGLMGDLDDGPDQEPLSSEEVEQAILELVPKASFDLILTHNPTGEYTRHLRHEETGQAVIALWDSGQLKTKALWLFAYEDQQGQHLPTAIETASLYRPLSKQTWEKKHHIITKIYGFEAESWEARTTPLAEAFWQFDSSFDAKNCLINRN
jgi:LmbE family N-acetylglucosaminyl deacetylase